MISESVWSHRVKIHRVKILQTEETHRVKISVCSDTDWDGLTDWNIHRVYFLQSEDLTDSEDCGDQV